ncbi:MAG TPA: LuxR family transcriptional regulator [Bacteroidetes bacterium]|nr:LuxR family transcriptional regulator [Bacteroidota bacterium]
MYKTIDTAPGETAYRKFMDFWKKEQTGKPFADGKKILQHIPTLDELARNSNSLFILFDVSRYKIIYFSKNIEAILGYSNLELQKRNVSLFFRILCPRQRLAPFNLVRWRKHIYSNIPKNANRLDLHFFYAGLRIRHGEGHIVPLLIRFSPLALNESGHAAFALIRVESAPHLLKADFYWARSSCQQSGMCVGYYHSKKDLRKMSDIVSEREKEVLRLIARGQSSKEIATKLFITQNTVEKHRRNMLARTGARDTTALVQICRQAGII